MQETKPLSIMDGKTLLSLYVEPPKFIISGFLPIGLHMLAGSPKIGKSWLALWLCNLISKGEKVWEFDTMQCGALYLSLEDTMERLHFRLSRMTEEGSEHSYFATDEHGLGVPTLILLEQIRTIDKQRLSGYVGRLAEQEMREVDSALAISLGLC